MVTSFIGQRQFFLVIGQGLSIVALHHGYIGEVMQNACNVTWFPKQMEQLEAGFKLLTRRREIIVSKVSPGQGYERKRYRRRIVQGLSQGPTRFSPQRCLGVIILQAR